MNQQINLGEQAFLPVGSSLTLDGDVTFTGTVSGAGYPPGGADSEIQFNSSGVFGASSTIAIDNTYKYLKITEPLTGAGVGYGEIDFYNNSGSPLGSLYVETSTGAMVLGTALTTVEMNNAGTVGINIGGSFEASAALQVNSTTKGFLSPRNSNPTGITSPATGLQVYNTTTNELNVYNGTSWVAVGTPTLPAGANTQLQFNNSGVFGASSSLTWNGTTLTATRFAGTQIDVNGTKAIDLSVGTGRNLLTSGGTFVLDWQNSILSSSGGTSINWSSRELRGATGTLALTWANTGVTLATSKTLSFTDASTNTVILQAPTSVTSYTLKWPVAQGSAGYVMLNDGSGNLSWGANGAGLLNQNTYTVGTASGTYTGSTTVFNLPFTYVQDGKSLQVMYNGQVLVSGVDYSETSNTSVTFASALTVGYTATFRTTTATTPSNTSVAQFQNYVIGTASGTYTGSLTVYNLPFAYTQNAKSLEVYYDGVQLIPGDDYTETTSTSITTTQSLVSGQKIAFRTISTIGNAAAVTALRENYVVGTSSGNYTGSTTVFNLINSFTPGGINLLVYLDGDLQTVGAGNDYVETNSTTVTFNNALTASQTVAFLFSQTVAPTGTVTSATAGQLAYYPSTGSTISGTPVLSLSGTRVVASNMVDTGGLRATSNSTFASGVGVEILYQSGSGIIESYDRTGAAFVPMIIVADGMSIRNISTEKIGFSSTGGVNILGTTTNDNAGAGFVGEYITSALDRSSGVTLLNQTAKTIVSIALTAGDWDVSGAFGFSPQTAVTGTGIRGGVYDTTDTLPPETYDAHPDSANGRIAVIYYWPSGSVAEQTRNIPTFRVSLAAPKTLYLIEYATFSAGTATGYGYLGARRAR